MNAFRLKKLLCGAILSLPLLSSAPSAAEEQIYVPYFTYRTGPFSAQGSYVADGLRDYMEMLNERDGGIGGVKILVDECETAYDTKKGIECYEAVKGKQPVVISPWTTGTALAIVPRAAVDKIPVLSMAHGLSASADGNVFPWIFNPPNTYWDGLAMIIRYIGDQEGGLESLKGKRIGYLYLDGGFGKEPIPLLEELSKSIGFDLKQYPVAPQEMQNQAAQWLGIRRDRPDYIVLFGWGAMNPTALKEASRAGFPADKIVSIWWPSEDDARSVGEAGKGFKVLNWHGVGSDFPAIQDIDRLLVETGKSNATKEKLGAVLYNRGVYNSVLVAESIRNAQQLTGKKVISPEDMRRGIETLNITAERWKEIGLEGFAGPIQLSCSDHNGHRSAFIQQWDGEKWVRSSDDIEPMPDLVMPLISAAAKEYAERNTGWPQRTEPCDNP